MRRPVDAERVRRFMRELGGEAERAFIAREGRLSFYHYDFYSQALSKIQRGHSQDRQDVREMIDRSLIDRQELQRRFEQIEPQLYRFSAIDPAAFRRAVEGVVSKPDA